MKPRPPPENTPRVIVLALLIAVALLAAVPAEEVALVAGFTVGFGILTWLLDPQVRACLSLPRRRESPRRRTVESGQGLVRDLPRSGT